MDTGKVCASGGFECVTSPLAALADRNPDAGTAYAEGCDVILMGRQGFSAALAAAEAAEVVVLGLGGTSGGSGSTKTTEKAADDIFYDAGDYIVPFGCAAEW